MIAYKCQSCAAVLESEVRLAGSIDVCPLCKNPNIVPSPKPRLAMKSWAIVAGSVAILILGAFIGFAIAQRRSPPAVVPVPASVTTQIALTPGTMPVDSLPAGKLPAARVDPNFAAAAARGSAPVPPIRSVEEARAAKLKNFQKLVMEKLARGVESLPAQPANLGKPLRINGIDDGIMRGYAVAIVWRPMFIVPAVGEIQKSGQGEELIENFKQFVSFDESAASSLKNNDIQDFQGRAALVLTLSLLLDVDSDEDAKLIQSPYTNDDEKRILLQAYRFWRHRGASVTKESFDRLMEMGLDALPTP